jgi:hypothetical protein
MSKNHTMPVLYWICRFREFRRQLPYTAAMRGGRIVVADFPIVQDMLGVAVASIQTSCSTSIFGHASNAVLLTNVMRTAQSS